MPRLPTAEDLGPPPSLESRRGIATIDATPLAKGAATLSAGVTKLGDAVLWSGVRQHSQEQSDEATFDKAKADAAFIPAHSKLLSAQADNPDTEGYERDSAAALREAAANIKDDKARQLWMMSKAGTLAGGTERVKGYADKAAADHELAGIRQSEDDGLQTIVHGSPEDADAMIEAVGTRYNELASKGYITEVQAQAAKKEFARRGIYARVGSLDPEDQIAAYKGRATGRDQVIDRITGVESGGDPTARNPNSSATGLGQFTDGTWLSTIEKHRPDLMQGRSQAAVLAMRNDPDLSREMTGHLLDDNNRALSAAGIPVTPTTSYLAHFLGAGGATSLLKAKPGTPVSDVLGSDQVAANPSVLAGKTVDSVVGWADRKMGATAEARLASNLPADQREIGLRRAESLYATEQRRAQQAQREEGQSLRARMSDDLASIEATGQGNPNLKIEDVARVLGPQAAQDYAADSVRSRKVYETLDGIGSLPEPQALQRLQQLQPKPGAEGFQADQQAYGRAAKQVDSMLSLRRTDPAKSVDTLPGVAQARAAAQYDTYRDGEETKRSIQPASAQAIVRARLSAQDQLGVAAPLAVTKGEADGIVREIHAAGDDGKKLQPKLALMQRTYGPYAERVLSDSFQLHGLNQDLAEQASRMLSKLGAGQRPNPSEERNLDRAVGSQQLDNALAGRGPPSSTHGAAPGRAAAAAEPVEFKTKLATDDLISLRTHRDDPTVRQKFEAVYGPGTADRALAEVDRRLPPSPGSR